MAYFLRLDELSSDTIEANGISGLPGDLLIVVSYTQHGDIDFDGLHTWSIADENKAEEVLKNRRQETISGIPFTRLEIITSEMGIEAINKIPPNAVDWMPCYSGIVAYFNEN